MSRLTQWSKWMSVLVIVGVGASSILWPSTVSQTPGNTSGQVAKPACTMGRRPLDGPLIGGLSLEKLVDDSKVIVNASVLSTAPGADRGGTPDNDVLLVSSYVLKGPNSLGQFAIAQSRSADFIEMQPGQQFILFLNNLNSTGAQLYPERPGIPRYQVNELAILCLDAGKIHVSPSKRSDLNFLRIRFEGVAMEKAVTDIQSVIRRSR